MRGQPKAVVAGHICLDVMPTFDDSVRSLHAALIPGSLTEVGRMRFATGGAVPNTGAALHKLGIDTVLLGKIGDDPFGKEVIRTLDRISPSLSRAMRVEAYEDTSYTIIISQPGTDRMFLHFPGANRTFGDEDVDDASLTEADLFHFGYPPFMDRMLVRDGEQSFRLFQRAKRYQITTSLDMAKPDPNHASGRVDWKQYLRHVLPWVDIFLPSIEELWFMLEPETYKQWADMGDSGDIAEAVDSGMLRRFSDALLAMGSAAAAIKLGDQGLYVRTTDDASRLERMGRCAPEPSGSWLNREILVPCFQTQVVGTTGAGDCTIAGFLAGLLNGWPLDRTAEFAAAVGACSVEAADSTSGVRSMEEVQERIRQGWKRCQPCLRLPHLKWNDASQMFERE